MSKHREFNINKPFKAKNKSKRFTVMFVPDSSARIRRISIPHWAFSLIAAPFLLIILIVVLFQYRIIDMGRLTDYYDSRVSDSSHQIRIVNEQKAQLEETLEKTREQLKRTENLLEQSRSDTEAAHALLDDFRAEMELLLAKAGSIDEVKNNILEIFRQLQELDMPFVFDEAALMNYNLSAEGGAYPDDIQEVLSELDIVLSNDILDMQQLEQFAQALPDYFDARPSGLPVPGGKVGPGFGYRINPITGRGREMHEGIDISANRNDGIYATADGVVSVAGWSGNGFGILVVIEHANDYSTYYAHNSRVLVRAGQEVTRGQMIARAGSTGRSTGVHCHYEVRKNGIPRDPMLYVRGNNP